MNFWESLLGREGQWAGHLDLEPKQIEELANNMRPFLEKQLPTSEVAVVLSVQNSEDLIVMMKYVTNFENVFRCQRDGFIRWTAEFPTQKDDVYTSIEWKDGQLTAYSRSCISVILNAETGKIISDRT